MIDAFVGEQPDLVQSFGNELLLAPVNVPVILIGLLILPGKEGFQDAVGEKGFELDLGTRIGWVGY